ncbi:MAG: efflux RND transporter permease subunit [Polyangia bacterium]
MSISDPFISRPIASSLVAAAMLLGGAIAFVELPISPLPRVDYPTISVGASLPGASPETMASSVATPLERRLGRIAGLTELTSTSQLGSTSLTLQFDIDRNVESAARDVQAAINSAGGDLPAGLPSLPSYRKVNPSDSPIIIISMRSDTLLPREVYDIGTNIVAQKLAQLEGVGQVNVGGGQQSAVRVQLDPFAVVAKGVSFDDVRAAIGVETLDGPKGQLSGGGQTQYIASNDQLHDAKGWNEQAVLRSPGAIVHVADLGQAVDSVENERIAGWTDSQRSVSLIVRRQPDANIIDVIKRVKAALPVVSRMISPAVTLTVSLDRSQTIRTSVHDVELSLVISVILVVLVVFLFLRSFAATLVPSIAVPLSLVATFGIMYLLGYSLDNLSLMALTISTGFVVDDAVVVTENIIRLSESGMPPIEAARKGAKQIGFTIISITCSLLAVFIPILFMGGIVGRLFRELAVTLAAAIAISALVSLTITPALCAVMLARQSHAPPGRFSLALERAYTAIEQLYARSLTFVLGHRTLVGIVTVLTVGLTIGLYVVIPKGLFPQQDTGVLIGTIEASQDISFPAMKVLAEQVNAIFLHEPDIDHMLTGIGSGGFAAGSNTGTLFIALKEGKRPTADQIINRLRPKLSKIVGLRIFLQAIQDVRVGGRSSRTQYQYTMQAADLKELATWAPRMLDKLRSVSVLRDVNSDQQTGGLQLHIEFDRDSASRLGITAQAVDDALNNAFGQRQIAVSHTQQNAYRVVLELDPKLIEGPETLDRIYVRGANGQVPLRAIATWSVLPTTLSVNHQSQFASITLSFNTGPGVALGDAVEAVRKAEEEVGLPASIKAGFAGTAAAFKDSLRTQPYLIAAALVLIYIVLGMLYESFIHPITILSTIPSAGLGALLALLVTGTDLSVIGIIAIILLIGIVKKNAIMMIDFAIEAERDEGLSSEAAIYKACVLRFRPILMTTLAALFGAVPLAIGGGVGSEMRQPLGIAIVGGLILSQLLTLFTTPVTYLFLDQFSRSKHKPSRSEAPSTPCGV